MFTSKMFDKITLAIEIIALICGLFYYRSIHSNDTSKENYNEEPKIVKTSSFSYDFNKEFPKIKEIEFIEKEDEIEEEEEFETIISKNIQNAQRKFPIEYIVKKGETLWGIAERTYNDGLMFIYIMETNNLKSENIRIGQKLILQDISNANRGELLLKSYDKLKELNSKPVFNSNYVNKDGMTYLGNYFITGYDPFCAHCCAGSTDGITASCKVATFNHTVAVKGLPFGTKIYIEGYGYYVVEDRGVPAGTIDVAVESHKAAYKITKHNVPVYIVN